MSVTKLDVLLFTSYPNTSNGIELSYGINPGIGFWSIIVTM